MRHLIATILCVWEIWSGSYNHIDMYHIFHWLAKKKINKNKLSGSLCRTQVLVIRDFTTTMCVYMSALLCNIYACVYVHMYTHTYALCGCTRHLRTCRYAAILVNRPSGISQTAAITVNRTKRVNIHVHGVTHSLHA